MPAPPAPIAGASIQTGAFSTITDGSGVYSIGLPVGTYNVTASAFGYSPQTVNGVVITDGGTTTQDFALVAAPSFTVSGHVRTASGDPIPNATVTIGGTPIPPATTDAAGSYSFASVPQGTYSMTATAGRCNDPQTQVAVVNGDITVDFALPQRHDNFGYFCQIVGFSYVDGDTPLALSGDDNFISVSLPFPFPFYGQSYNTAFVGHERVPQLPGGQQHLHQQRHPQHGHAQRRHLPLLGRPLHGRLVHGVDEADRRRRPTASSRSSGGTSASSPTLRTG